MNLASLFVAYLTRQTRNNKLSQNHNSLIFITNPLQTYSKLLIKSLLGKGGASSFINFRFQFFLYKQR